MLHVAFVFSKPSFPADRPLSFHRPPGTPLQPASQPAVPCTSLGSIKRPARHWGSSSLPSAMGAHPVGAQGSQHLTLSVPTVPNNSVFLPKCLEIKGGKSRSRHAFLPTAPAEQVPWGTLISLQIKVSRVVLLSGHFVNS